MRQTHEIQIKIQITYKHNHTYKLLITRPHTDLKRIDILLFIVKGV